MVVICVDPGVLGYRRILNVVIVLVQSFSFDFCC